MRKSRKKSRSYKDHLQRRKIMKHKREKKNDSRMWKEIKSEREERKKKKNEESDKEWENRGERGR